MFALTILHDDGTTTRDRLNRINDGEGTSITKFVEAISAWEQEKQNPDNKAVFLTNGTIVVRRWER